MPGTLRRADGGEKGISMEAATTRVPTCVCLARRGWIPAGLALCLGLAGGCILQEKTVGPVVVANRDFGAMTIAVAPALNLSGAADFDPDRFADLMASELSYV